MEDRRQDSWGEFAYDPRDPAHGALRASDHDRDVVRSVLSAAYADGRLDPAELDERSDLATAARTLGELPSIIDDLVAPSTLPAHRAAGGLVADSDLAAEAQRRYASDRREALASFIGPSVICVVIWSIVMFGGFFWPGFVIAGTGINLIQTLVRRKDIIDQHERRLQKKQAKQFDKDLSKQKRRELDGPNPPADPDEPR